MKALDPITALTLIMHADKTHLITLRGVLNRRIRTYCLEHLEDKEHRAEHIGDAKKSTPSFFHRLMIRDQLEEATRRGTVEVYGVQKQTYNNWSECRHCRAKQRIGGHA